MGLGREHFTWVDVAKAISIFGVVYIHSGAVETETTSLNNGSYFRFCVPIFIMLAFFLSEHSLQRQKNYSKRDFLKKRVTRLFIPYLGWSVLYAVGQFYLGITSKLDFGMAYSWAGQYFFVILIQLTLLYPWLRTLNINLKGVIFILGLTAILTYLPRGYFGVNIPFIFGGQAPFFYWIFYVFLGIFLARNIPKIDQILSSVPSAIVTFLIALLPGFMVVESFFLKSSLPYLRLSVLFVSSILIILLTQFNSLPQFWHRVVRILSRYSLGIFCMNSIVIHAIYRGSNYFRLQDSVLAQTPDLLARGLLAVVSCMISLLLCSLLERAKLGVFVR